MKLNDKQKEVIEVTYSVIILLVLFIAPVLGLLMSIVFIPRIIKSFINLK